MLKNRIYRGEIVRKGKAFPGEHAAIVDEELWKDVQGHSEENRLERREGDSAIEPSLLTGTLFDARCEPITPTYAVKKGTRYRYYISRRLIAGIDADNSDVRRVGQRLPAANLEALVTGRLRSLVADPVEILNAIAPGEHDAPAQRRMSDAAAALAARWDGMSSEALRRSMRSLIVRAQVHAARIDLDVSATQLARRLLSDGGAEGVPECDAHVDGGEEYLVRSSIPARLKRTGKEMKFIVDSPTISAPADTSLIRLVVRSQKIGEHCSRSAVRTSTRSLERKISRPLTHRGSCG